MVSAEAARTTVGIIGNIISLVLFSSPAPTFIKIWKKGSVEQYSPMPYLATFFNCGMWILYGLPRFHPHSLLVLTINGSGFVTELVYLMLFFIYSDKRQRLRVVLIMLTELAFIAVVALLVSSLVHKISLRTTIAGSICMFGCFLMYASPLSIMKMVIRTKSVEYMPFFLSLFSFLNGACWTAYALIRFDAYIARRCDYVHDVYSQFMKFVRLFRAPNGLGLLIGAAQLILYATLCKSTKRQIEARQSKGEMGLAGIAHAHADAVSSDPRKVVTHSQKE